MADHHGSHTHDDPSSGGTMDISDHVKTWLAFWNGATYMVGAIAVLAILLAIFRTHNGMY